MMGIVEELKRQPPAPLLPESSLDGLCEVPGTLPCGQVTRSREHGGCLHGPPSWPLAGQPLTWQAGGAAHTHSHSPSGRHLHPAPLAAPPALLCPGPRSAVRTRPFGRGPLGPWAGHDLLTLACGPWARPPPCDWRATCPAGATPFPPAALQGGRCSQGSA